MICMRKPSIDSNTLLCQMAYVVKEKGAEPQVPYSVAMHTYFIYVICVELGKVVNKQYR